MFGVNITNIIVAFLVIFIGAIICLFPFYVLYKMYNYIKERFYD